MSRTTADLFETTAPPEPTGLWWLAGRKLRRVSVAGGRLVVDERIFEEDPVNFWRCFDTQRVGQLSSGSRGHSRNVERLTRGAASARSTPSCRS
jgi:hypothetical protein